LEHLLDPALWRRWVGRVAGVGFGSLVEALPPFLSLSFFFFSASLFYSSLPWTHSPPVMNVMLFEATMLKTERGLSEEESLASDDLLSLLFLFLFSVLVFCCQLGRNRTEILLPCPRSCS